MELLRERLFTNKHSLGERSLTLGKYLTDYQLHWKMLEMTGGKHSCLGNKSSTQNIPPGKQTSPPENNWGDHHLRWGNNLGMIGGVIIHVG